MTSSRAVLFSPGPLGPLLLALLLASTLALAADRPAVDHAAYTAALKEFRKGAAKSIDALKKSDASISVRLAAVITLRRRNDASAARFVKDKSTVVADEAIRAIHDLGFEAGRPAVAAVIVGARNRSHLPRNVAISELALTTQDLAEIAAIQAEGNIPEGDTYTLERDRHGRHGNIIKYNLNAAS